VYASARRIGTGSSWPDRPGNNERVVAYMESMPLAASSVYPYPPWEPGGLCEVKTAGHGTATILVVP
jgi:hypothetical protein